MSVAEKQAIRNRRAVDQAADYTIRRAVTSGEGEGFSFWVISAGKRSINHVHQGRCSCKDYEKRCQDAAGRPNGLKCKHIILVEKHLGIGEALPVDDTEPALEPVEFEHLSAREASLQDADEHCGPEDYGITPSIEAEIRLGLQDEERFARIRRERDELWP